MLNDTLHDKFGIEYLDLATNNPAEIGPKITWVTGENAPCVATYTKCLYTHMEGQNELQIELIQGDRAETDAEFKERKRMGENLVDSE